MILEERQMYQFLYIYKAEQLELPITIGHNGSGVKVNDLPTWTGINWTLTICNVINRTVNDNIDENYSGVYRVYSEETALLNATATTCSPGATFYYDVTPYYLINMIRKYGYTNLAGRNVKGHFSLKR